MIAAFTVGLAVALAVTPAVRAIGRRHELLDHPSERSSHALPTPRGGGIAILAALAAVLVIPGAWAPATQGVILGCTAVVAILGFIDDVKSLSAGLRLAVQVAAAAAMIVFANASLQSAELPLAGEVRLPLWLGVGISVFWLVGVTNAYNFMDGVNGIAAIEAVVCAGSYAVLLYSLDDLAGAMLCAGIAGGAAGFLAYNASGSIFMGDVGSGALGFFFAAMALRLTAEGVPFAAVVLPLLPFLLDTAVTLVRRARRGERLFSAHRSHFYQRLTDFGWSHMRVSVVYGVAAAGCATVALRWKALTPSALASLVVAIAMMLVVLSLLLGWWLRSRRP
jgi:UDP-GlcNAc:undecaprenyl-phosphate/decaprenyl-phosphate GlcNAc-1-phosphate transferase